MAKKRSKRANKIVKQKEENDNYTIQSETEMAEKPFDFGGIPARDLKKNIGC
jgi:hypothetical protein